MVTNCNTKEGMIYQFRNLETLFSGPLGHQFDCTSPVHLEMPLIYKCKWYFECQLKWSSQHLKQCPEIALVGCISDSCPNLGQRTPSPRQSGYTSGGWMVRNKLLTCKQFLLGIPLPKMSHRGWCMHIAGAGGNKLEVKAEMPQSSLYQKHCSWAYLTRWFDGIVTKLTWPQDTSHVKLFTQTTQPLAECFPLGCQNMLIY